MKIQRAEFLGVAGVPDLTIDLPTSSSGEPHDRVVVTGPSGAGKTRLLEALIAAKEAIRPYGALAPGAPWIRSGQAAKIRLAFRLDDDERDFAAASSHVLRAEVIFHPTRIEAEADDGLRAVLGRYSHNGAHGKVDYFPAERRIPTFPPFGGLAAGEQRVARLTKDTRKYGFVLPLLQTFAHDAPRRQRFEAALASLSPSCRFVPGSDEAIPRCFSSRGGEPVSVGQLSHGESDAVIFAATAALIGLDHSLVFLDRPDLHADEPEALIDALGVLGEGNQLWMACSPRTAAAAHGVHVVTLKR